MNRKLLMRHQNGFTLIELLTVIAIIGILAATVILLIGSATIRARNTAAISDIAAGGQAIEAYRISDTVSDKVISNNHGSNIDTLNGTTGTLSSIFNGKLNTTPGSLSYPANYLKTPSGSYTYSYTVPNPSVSAGRNLVGPYQELSQNLYILCTNIVAVGSSPASYRCASTDGLNTLDYNPTGAGARVIPRKEIVPNYMSDGMAAFNPNDGLIYLLGGQSHIGAGGTTKDVFSYNPDTGLFAQTQSLANPVLGHTGVWVPTPQNGTRTPMFYLFGGLPNDQNNIQTYQPGTNRAGTSLTQKLPLPAIFATSVYDPDTDKVYIIGSSPSSDSAGEYNGDYIQEFDPNAPGGGIKVFHFTQFNPDGATIKGRAHAPAFYDSTLKRIVIFSGEVPEKDPGEIIWLDVPLTGLDHASMSYGTSSTGDRLVLPSWLTGLNAGWDFNNKYAFLLAGYAKGGATNGIVVYKASGPTLIPRTETMPLTYAGNSVVFDPNTHNGIGSAFSFGGYQRSQFQNSAPTSYAGSVVEYLTDPYFPNDPYP